MKKITKYVEKKLTESKINDLLSNRKYSRARALERVFMETDLLLEV